MAMPGLAGGRRGTDELRPLVDTVFAAPTEGARRRDGPVPAGGPEAVAALVGGLGEVLPGTRSSLQEHA